MELGVTAEEASACFFFRFGIAMDEDIVRELERRRRVPEGPETGYKECVEGGAVREPGDKSM